MLAESMATSLIVGKVRGGKIKNIGNTEIKGWYLFILGFILEFSSVLLKVYNVPKISTFLYYNFTYIHIISYIFIFLGLILNFNKKSMIIILIGALLNFAVIIVNDGKMPVSGEGLAALALTEELQSLESDSIITHTLVTEETKLYFLGDVIATPSFYPLPKMFSIGDIFIGLGVFFFIQGAMTDKRKFKTKGKMISFGYKGR